MDKFLPSSYNFSGSIGPGTYGGSYSDGSLNSYGCLNTSPLSSVCMDRFQDTSTCLNVKVPFVPVATSVCVDNTGATAFCVGPSINVGKYASIDLQACWETKK